MNIPVETEDENTDHGPDGIEIPVETYRMENGTSLVLSFILQMNYDSTVFTAGTPLYQTVTAHMVCTSESVACSFRQYSVLPRLVETLQTWSEESVDRLQQATSKVRLLRFFPFCRLINNCNSRLQSRPLKNRLWSRNHLKLCISSDTR